MSDFSCLLSQYISEKNMKIYTVSRKCQIDRSTLYRFLNGKQQPVSLQLVLRLANVLELNQKETSRLCEAWHIAKAGRLVWSQRKSTEHFLLNFPDRAIFSSSHTYDTVQAPGPITRDIQLLKNKAEIYSAFREIAIKEAETMHPELMLTFQPDNSELINILLQLPNRRVFHIDHIFCLNNHTPSTPDCKIWGFYNMECLELIMPLYISGLDYHPWYYYDDVKAHFSSMSLLPYMLLTKSGAIICSSDLTFGILHTDDSVISLLQDVFKNHWHQTHSLAALYDWTDIQFISQLQNMTGKESVLFSPDPCLYTCLNSERLQKYFLPEVQKTDGLFSSFILYLSAWKNYTENAGTVCYCTPEGFERFMATGRINILPKNVLQSFSFKDRCMYLEHSGHLIKNGKIILLKEPFRNLSHHFQLAVNAQTLIFCFADQEDRICGLVLKEPSLVNAFFEFFYSGSSDITYSIDESYVQIRKMMV